MNGWCGSRKETVRFLALWKGIRGVHRRRDPQKLWGSDQTVDRGCGFWRQKGFNGKKKVDFVGLWIVEDDDADVFRVPRISLFFSEREMWVCFCISQSHSSQPYCFWIRLSPLSVSHLQLLTLFIEVSEFSPLVVLV